jgi:hypothetical protein
MSGAPRAGRVTLHTLAKDLPAQGANGRQNVGMSRVHPAVSVFLPSEKQRRFSEHQLLLALASARKMRERLITIRQGSSMN